MALSILAVGGWLIREIENLVDEHGGAGQGGEGKKQTGFLVKRHLTVRVHLADVKRAGIPKSISALGPALEATLVGSHRDENSGREAQ